MKKIIIAVVGTLILSTGIAQSKLEVSVATLKETKGSLRIGLYNNNQDFTGKPLTSKIVKADKPEITVEFSDVLPGKYAVAIIHDENDNDELDSNFMGIPKEGFGFSNNAMGIFGPPSFEKASFEVKEPMHRISVSLKYF